MFRRNGIIRIYFSSKKLAYINKKSYLCIRDKGKGSPLLNLLSYRIIMNVKNLFKIEEVLELSGNKYYHVSPFVGAVDVDIMLGGIKEDESDFRLKSWNGNAIIVYCKDEVDRENLWQVIYRCVECRGDEKVKVWFFTNLKNMPIMIIPVEF